ncbi:MAG: AAA family ATPase [Chloroflexi bacterium]|nr:AAA family ATPase [Chloroflexota bacterium]
MTELEQLAQAIAILAGQRAILGDTVVDAALGPMREKLADLQAPATPAEQKRRQVTVLFADVSGFTALAEQMDAEDVAGIMNALWAQLDDAITVHGGHIDKHLGDGVMAVWGAETAREDDPERAIRAALAMQAAMAAFRAARGVPLAMRIGLNTGPVLLGEVGSTHEFTAMGDTVNLAARLEQAAPVGGVLIAHDTYRHVRGVFDVQPQPPLTVKGKAAPVQTYLVLRAKPRAFRLETRGVEGVETRTIGREAELQALQNAYLDAVEGHETRIALVSGDAGVGKSRLLYEFLNWAELRPERFWLFKGRARAETQDVPYAVVKDLFSNRFEIRESDSATAALAKFRAGMAGFLAEDQADLVGHLAGFDFRAAGSPAVSNLLGSGAFVQLATAGLWQYLRAMTAQQPLLMVQEDLHWADDSSLDLIDHIVTEVPGARLLLVCLARPGLFERQPSWGPGRAAYVRLPLQPLSRRQSRALVGEILKKAASIPNDLTDLILDGAEGNPFYVEELIKMLIEEGVIVAGEEPWRVELPRLKSLRVPPTLTGVLQARLDSLPPEALDVLQRASVVGRVFWDGAVAALAPLAGSPPVGPVAPLLDVVSERELVFRREHSSFSGAQEYIFKHVILHDVTYETVLLKLRRMYHKQVAQWLEANAGDRVGEYAALMAQHYERAGERGLAADWLQRVARDAIDTGAFREVVRACERALALLPEGEQAARAELLARLGEGRGFLGDVAAAQRDITAGLALAREAHDLQTAAYAASALSSLAYRQGEFGAMQAPAAEALALARAAGDKYTEALALLWLGNAVYLHQHDLALGRRYLEESLSLFQELGRGWGIGACLNNLGEVHRIERDYVSAAQYYEQSLAVRRQAGHRAGVAITLFNLGEVMAAQNDLATAGRCHQEGLAVAEEIGLRMIIWCCQSGLGHSAAASGDVAAARRYFQRALAGAVEARGLSGELCALVGFARLQALAGEPVRAAEWVGLVLAHPSCEVDEEQRAAALLAELRAALPAEELAAALARGAKLQLAEVVAEILSAVDS